MADTTLRVCVLRNYDYPDLRRQTPGNRGTWQDIEFIFEPVPDCDYIVVFNHPKADIDMTVRKGGAWLIIQEPPYDINAYLKRYFSYFDKVITAFPPTAPNMISTQAMLPWHLDQSYDFLKVTDGRQAKKSDHITWITSNLNRNPGHTTRLAFMEQLQHSTLNIELYGRGIRPIDNKWDTLVGTKYSIAAENFYGADYWTEKLVDVIMAGSIPFYYGCSNLDKYLPRGSFVPIDITQPGKAIAIMKEAIEGKHWENHQDALAEAKELLLEKYQFFPAIKALVDQHRLQNPNALQRKVIPAFPITFGEKLNLWAKKLMGKNK